MVDYDELLKLCAFDEAEIAAQRTRIERAFEKLNLGPQDMERAVNRVQKYFDIELLGVRKSLGIWLKELFDAVLAREEGKKTDPGTSKTEHSTLNIETGVRFQCSEIVAY